MQYVRSISGSVSKTWNSINPATLSGAIDVIVVEQGDGTLACSPFHVRFGKFSLLRPSEKKVEFKVNHVKQDYSMKLGEGGEAFFVFETTDQIPESLQTSPLISAASSPDTVSAAQLTPSGLVDPPFLDITDAEGKKATGDSPEMSTLTTSEPSQEMRLSTSESGGSTNIGGTSGTNPADRLRAKHLFPRTLERSHSEEVISTTAKQRHHGSTGGPYPLVSSAVLKDVPPVASQPSELGYPSPSPKQALNRALTLSKKLSVSNIKSQVTAKGDLKLDMTGYKSTEDDALRAEIIARKILAEEMEGNYEIGSLIDTDENGNLWIYSSEQAKEAAHRDGSIHELDQPIPVNSEAASDPGYHSDSDQSSSGLQHRQSHQRGRLDGGPVRDSLLSLEGEPSRNYAKTLRLTSDQLKALKLKPGPNAMSFTVNRATCHAYMYYWSHDVPIVISDIDGTITKSDALGHVLNMIGRDWTHIGVAKLYTDIVTNGYNILYLTSRSVGQADTTRAYLNGVAQEGQKLPRGPVIMSPDRTIAALRREIYLRKPEVFKMACLRDILGLFPGRTNPFYGGFGNRFTDALSYRTVNIPSTRIFTINSNAEVSLDLMSLNKYRSSYVSMRELVDHFFPPVSMLIEGGAEEFTDFNYWRDTPRGLDDFVVTDSEDGEEGPDENDDEGGVNEFDERYLSRESTEDNGLEDSFRESFDLDGRISSEEDLVDDYIGESGVIAGIERSSHESRRSADSLQADSQR